MSILKINGADYSNHVIAGSYQVNTIKKYKEWEDGFGTTHHDQRKAKIEGLFDMFFRTEIEYQTFLDDLESAKYNAEYQHVIELKSNNENTSVLKSIRAYVDFKPTRDLDNHMEDYFGTFSVEIKEA